MGLYQSKEIVERHGGEITLKSRLNQGTECIITLPIIQ
ncbi:MAG TPA: ATP-binding protein [Syntrophaceae bacterium]|nr:ATP-binding protein [Syntrophaceae bacterium]